MNASASSQFDPTPRCGSGLLTREGVAVEDGAWTATASSILDLVRSEPGSAMSDDVVDLLIRSPVFCDLSPPEAEQFAARGRRLRLDRQEVVFVKGAPADALYLVVRGRVGIESSSVDGHVLAHRSIEPGEVFGEIGMLDGGERTASASAEVDGTELLVIRRVLFDEFLGLHPHVARALLVVLARRLRSTSNLLEDTLFRGGLSRVARRLLESARSTNGQVPRVDLTQEEIGNRAGLSRVSVNAQLKRLKALGLVELEPGRVRLTDMAGLSAIANDEGVDAPFESVEVDHGARANARASSPRKTSR